jgi:hypothetical protein
MTALVPQWKYWKQIPSVEIWQAILLTMDREPRNYLLSNSVLFDLADCVNPYEEHYGITISGYDEKITIACANIGDRGFPETRQSSSDEQERAIVRLDEFVSWAISHGWQMTDECSALKAKPVSLGIKDEESPNFHKNTTDELMYLCQASRKFWMLADPKDKSTYPDKKLIIEWLVKKGFSASLADKSASIIRPKWAGSGRSPDKV